MTLEWFRTPDWGEAARDDFEQRLRRARGYNRPQYLRIKGLALADAGQVEAARELWLRVLDCTDGIGGLDQAGALEQLADSYAREDPRRAEHHYRRLLTEHPSRNCTSGTQDIKLAEILIDRGSAADLKEAEDLLSRWDAEERSRSPFPMTHFRRQLAAVRLAEAKGDHETARQAARLALGFAVQGPVFDRHKTIGVVHADELTLKRLERLAK